MSPFVSWSLGATKLLSPPILPKTFLGRIVKAAAPRPAFFKKLLLLLSIFDSFYVLVLYTFHQLTNIVIYFTFTTDKTGNETADYKHKKKSRLC